MIRRPPRSTQSRSSAASDVYKRQVYDMMCKYSFRQAFYRQVERGNRWYAVNINNTTNMKAKGENSTNKAQPQGLSLIHISEPTRRTPISYAVFCLKKKNSMNGRSSPRRR
eukprot:TRINITY_DN6729_c0_g1_i13.p3 TRINITY_DN6729_c0_g1~~TRINITY_DN6729_c0_g1_i13.p3  ORF type:complete len:111 (-),score=32.97 TRINITY_DN6729_c0_g1_i13:34-366(-)